MRLGTAFKFAVLALAIWFSAKVAAMAYALGLMWHWRLMKAQSVKVRRGRQNARRRG